MRSLSAYRIQAETEVVLCMAQLVNDRWDVLWYDYIYALLLWTLHDVTLAIDDENIDSFYATPLTCYCSLLPYAIDIVSTLY